MNLSDCQIIVTEYLVGLIERKMIKLPAEIRLSQIERAVRCRPQNVGMAFDEIAKALGQHGLKAEKRGTPVRIFLRRL